MPKRRKKGGTKNSKALALKRNSLISRDTTKCITSPNVSLEQSISSGYDVIWNDRSPVTDQQPIIGQSLMRTLQGKEGLVQKKEGHQLLELFKSNMQSIHQHRTSDSELQVKRSRRQQLEEISKVQNELKQLAKRLQYYDEDEMEGELQQQQHSHNNIDHNRLSGDAQVTSSVTSVTTTSNNTCTNITTRGRVKAQCSDNGGGVKAQCSDSGVVESDTDTMSCCDDDSLSDQYQPIGSHHCGGVAYKNKTVGKCIASQDGGVAKTRPLQSVNSNSNNFPGITSDDDPELDRIFASVEMTTNDCYNDTTEDEQFWSTAAIELSHQEVGLVHSTPRRPPAPPTVTNSNDSSGADFIDMILTYNNDIDLILNQN